MSVMSVRTVAEIINVIVQLAEHEKLRVTVDESVKGAVITGLCTLAGGLLGGRSGLLLGGAIGTGLGALTANDFKSVVYIIRYEMTSKQRTELAVSMMNILTTTGVSCTLNSILENEAIRSSVIKLIGNGVEQMGYKMVA